MPYDPQRSHRRPQLADDAPAPIDALLGNGTDAPEPADTPATEASPHEPSSPEPGPPPRRDDVTIEREIDVEIVRERGRPLVALVAVALLVVVLVLAWVRRRR
jgi:hypothetical protein